MLWASKGECQVNPTFMHQKCKKSCGACGNSKHSALLLDPENESSVIEATLNCGEKQVAEGTEKVRTLDRIRKSIEYFKNEVPSLPDSVKDKCKNRHELCSFWAVLGECEKNQRYMVTNCAVACRSCHLIDMETRCPPLTGVKPALGAGDLNKMFERIVREAPGNRTLSDEDRKELEEKGLTEYTVTVLSSPSDDVSASSRKAKASPWIITFDNFLTPEEAQAIIDIGYEFGYERSKDVGAENFDGSFESMESQGRTSENAWCDNTKGCRDREVIQKVTKRMSEIMGIPPENSEDLQILKYEQGQFYEMHHDYIPHQKDRPCGPRILTFFLYLSDVEAGGGTLFTHLGITVQPRLGKAILWPSVLDSDPFEIDSSTYHQAMPVEKGVKFAANGWIHSYDYLSAQARGCN
jgi:prolyl 4-hydroxylase